MEELDRDGESGEPGGGNPFGGRKDFGDFIFIKVSREGGGGWGRTT